LIQIKGGRACDAARHLPLRGIAERWTALRRPLQCTQQ
jgi:hypothetical protein